MPEPSGSATVLLSVPPTCYPEDAAVHLATQVLQESPETDGLAFIVLQAVLHEAKPGIFEVRRKHHNLSRWIPPFPDAEPYSEGAEDGFKQACMRAAGRCYVS